jgi:outer membrane immunogenic protein
MRRRRLAAVLLTVFAAGTAQAVAADAPAPIATKAPIAAPEFSWTGFYAGVVAGAGRATTRHTHDVNGATSGDARIDGKLFGVTYGFNWQSNAWVVGLEGDFSRSGIGGHHNSSTPFCPGGGIDCVTDLRWFGTGRARLGFTWNRFLPFVTAGVAYGKVSGTITFPGFTQGDNWRAAFIYGAGAEWEFAPRWSVKAEYLKADSLGDKVTHSGIERISLKDLRFVRVGLNYRF